MITNGQIRTTFSLAFVVLATLVLTANAAVLTVGTTAPTIDGLDIANLAAATTHEKLWSDTRAIGQTFTMGSQDAVLNAITLQSWSASPPTKNYTLTVGDVSGTSYNAFATESGIVQSVNSVAGDYWTFTLDTPVTLSANALYGFDLAMNSSTTGWGSGIPYRAVTGDLYADGQQFRSQINAQSTPTISTIGGDKVFHLDLAAVSVGPPPIVPSLVHVATDQVSNDHSVFDVSVYPGQAGYDDGTDTGAFGDGTVLDYRFFNNSGTTFNEAGYANGGAGLVSEATATNSDGTNGGALDWADVWTTNDPSADPANFTADTFARSQGVTGTVDISGLEEGSLDFIFGSFANPNTISLTMTGEGVPDIVEEHTEDPPNTNQAWISSFYFSDAADYDTISWAYTNTDTDGSRARFMGLILDGIEVATAIPEPSSFVLAAISLLGLAAFVQRRKR